MQSVVAGPQHPCAGELTGCDRGATFLLAMFFMICGCCLGTVADTKSMPSPAWLCCTAQTAVAVSNARLLKLMTDRVYVRAETGVRMQDHKPLVP